MTAALINMALDIGGLVAIALLLTYGGGPSNEGDQ